MSVVDPWMCGYYDIRYVIAIRSAIKPLRQDGLVLWRASTPLAAPSAKTSLEYDYEVLSDSGSAGSPSWCLFECCRPVHHQSRLPDYLNIYVDPKPYGCSELTPSISSPSSSKASMVPQRDILSWSDATSNQPRPSV